MKEIEVKILNVDPRKVARKLRALGAKKVFSGEMQAVYYDLKRSPLTKRGVVLRLRSKKGKVELTYKKQLHKKKVKACEEYECLVADFASMDKIIRALGLTAARVVRKHRVTYKNKKLSFEIDTYPGLPPLLEIESPTIKDLRKAVKALGYKMSETVSWNSFEVLNHYRGRGK